MPAQVYISQAQLQVAVEFGCDVVAVEHHNGSEVLEFWVLENLDQSWESDTTHRSVVVDQEGQILSDKEASDG